MKKQFDDKIKKWEYGSAESLYQRVVRARHEILGPCHQDILDTYLLSFVDDFFARKI